MEKKCVHCKKRPRNYGLFCSRKCWKDYDKGEGQ